LGSLLPAGPERSQNARPIRCSVRCPRPRKRLLGLSSRGVQPSFTVFPEVPAHGLSTEGTSLGVPRPYSARGGESPRLAGCPVELPDVSARNLPAGPTPPATVPLTGFLNLSAAFFLSPPSHHFQAGGARGVFPSGVCSFHEDPTTRRRRHALLTLLLRIALSPFLGGDIRRRAVPSPRLFQRGAFVRLQGLRLRGNRSSHLATVNSAMTDLPLLGFHLPMVCTPAGGRRFPHAAVTLGEPPVRRRTSNPLRSTACRLRGPALSHEGTVPSQGSSPSTYSPIRAIHRRGLMRLAPFRLGAPSPSRDRAFLLCAG